MCHRHLTNRPSSPIRLQVLSRFAWLWTSPRVIRVVSSLWRNWCNHLPHLFCPFPEGKTSSQASRKKLNTRQCPHYPEAWVTQVPKALSLKKLSLHFNKTSRCLMCTLEGQTGGLKECRSNQLAVAGLIPRGRNGNSLKIVF